MARPVPAVEVPARLRVRAGARLALSDASAERVFGWAKDDAEAALDANRKVLGELQYKLYQQSSAALLVVLQAMDAAGKDSTIRHVITAFNPQGCNVHAFKVPSEEERAHDFLWREHLRTPAFGSVAVFNRSHYEAVLVERVGKLVPPSVWRKRYAHINDFERMLTDGGTRVVKIFLQVSRKEQKKRLDERRQDPEKNWKWDPGDLVKRAQWTPYQNAYRDMLARCSPAHAPWHVIPADRKWFRNLAVSQILIEALQPLVARKSISRRAHAPPQ